MNPSLADRLSDLRIELQGANLLAVSKYSQVPQIVEAYRAGQRDFGENRIQDLEEKAHKLEEFDDELGDIRWHFIGHLQSNKIGRLLEVPHLFAIHSINSLEKLRKLNKKMSHFKGERLQLFLQVKTSFEEEKQGFSTFEQLQKVARAFASGEFDERLELTGLMTMSALRTEDFETQARDCFRQLRHWRDGLSAELELSMGMSQDYKIALEEGSDWVRIGSKIFRE